MENNQNSNQDFVYCLAGAPNFETSGLLFAAKQSGLYRSTHGGQTWESAYASLELEANLPTTYVGVSAIEKTAYVFACVKGNVLRSLNNGESWEVTELSSPAPVVIALAISPNFAEDGVLLAGTMQAGIFRSTNRSVTWTGWNFGLFDPNINALAISPNFATDQTILAGTQSGIFCSTNGGRSWRDLDFPIELAPVLALARDQNGKIYAGTDEGLYAASDGQAWEQLIGGVVDQILLDQNQILVVQESTLLQSSDAGQSWEPRTGFRAESDISCLVAPLGLDPAHTLLVGLSDGQVIKL